MLTSQTKRALAGAGPVLSILMELKPRVTLSTKGGRHYVITLISPMGKVRDTGMAQLAQGHVCK